MNQFDTRIDDESFNKWLDAILEGRPVPDLQLCKRVQTAFDDHRPEKSAITDAALPPDEVSLCNKAPYHDQDRAIRAFLQSQGIVNPTAEQLKSARELTVNRKDLHYHPNIPNLEQFEHLTPRQREQLQKQQFRARYRHNSPMNGTSFFAEDGSLVEVSHAVSSSDFRQSSTTHLLRCVEDEQTKETMFYTGRPDTREKLEEQAEFVFLQEL